MATWLELLIAICLLGGAAFALVGAIGIVKLPDLFTRLHGPTKSSTLGVGGIMLGTLLYFSAIGDGLSLRELLLALFLFITAPVSAHLVAKAALHIAPDHNRDPALDRRERKPE
jgi:multicomponent K+:H+ antiporter subunit G